LDGLGERYRWKTNISRRGFYPEPIKDANDRADYNRLLAGVPRTQ
jgi:hypothetical protein